MPITAWSCPVCRKEVPLSHFADTLCGTQVPPDYAQAILDDRAREREGGVRVTAGLGCPRSRALEADADVAVNPLDYNALLIGQAWDGFLATSAPAGLAHVQVKGTLAGVQVGGEIDRMLHTPHGIVIADWKHSNNFRQKWVKKEGVATEYKIQTSLYAELYAQTFGDRPTAGAVWYHFSGQSAEPISPMVYELLDVDTCLQHKPYGGKYTVEELYRQTAGYLEADVRDPFALPLVGETMNFGSKSFCDYCQVRAKCFEAAKGAPF